jgi:hypothetical protein
MVSQDFINSCPERLKAFALSDVSVNHIIFNSKLPFIRFDYLMDKNLIIDIYNELKIVRETFYKQPGVEEPWSRGTLIKHFYYRNKYENYQTDPDYSKPLVWSDDTPPTIKKFFSEMLGDIVYSRIQCDLLLPGGYIAPHADTNPLHNGVPGQLVSLNLAITHPAGCYFYIQNYGHIPFKKSGDAFLIDTCIPHCVINDSNEERYHFKIHIDYDKSIFKDKNILNRSYFKTLGSCSNLDLLKQA